MTPHPRASSDLPPLQEVRLEVVRTCKFVAKPCRICGKAMSNPDHRDVKNGKTIVRVRECVGQKQNGCAVCGGPKNAAHHQGAPPSFNAMAGRDPNVYRSEVETLKRVLVSALAESGLPKGLGSVHVEGEVSFGDGKGPERDQGNFRVLPEKALGDALEAEGYIESDTWSHYTFGNLELREDGRNRLALFLFPAWPKDPAEEPAADGSLALFG